VMPQPPEHRRQRDGNDREAPIQGEHDAERDDRLDHYVHDGRKGDDVRDEAVTPSGTPRQCVSEAYWRPPRTAAL